MDKVEELKYRAQDAIYARPNTDPAALLDDPAPVYAPAPRRAPSRPQRRRATSAQNRAKLHGDRWKAAQTPAERLQIAAGYAQAVGRAMRNPTEVEMFAAKLFQLATEQNGRQR